ncbi:MAG TPA: adenylyl-sulfate reductase subunit beta [Candidatus Sulfobium mesophilum]|jgi:adenylylsulfate reductase subunit B|nr:adenylyl-sulfate reductase subunit beta [Candidatus Sulfobium mesophilum]
MPSFVDPAKCDGCKGGEKTACMYICPSDLMVLNVESMKAYNQEPDQCWECYSCVKICPQGAISVRAYSDIVPLGGMVSPMMSSDSIMWTIQFRNGNLQRFKFPIRTTPEGSIDPKNAAHKGKNLGDELLSDEEADGYQLPKPKAIFGK